VLDLLRAGRSVAQVAANLQISDQLVYSWQRRERIDSGQMPGVASADHAELVAARRSIAELPRATRRSELDNLALDC
jgi:transposase